MEVGTIYRIQNTAHGKAYIGATVNLKGRITSHQRAKKGAGLLHHAIQACGWESFSVDVIGEYPKKHLSVWEQDWIHHLRTKAPDGYNSVVWSVMNDEIAQWVKKSERLRDLMSSAQGRTDIEFFQRFCGWSLAQIASLRYGKKRR